MSEIDYLLLCICMMYFGCITIFLRSEWRAGKDRLNPMMFICFFAYLDAFSLMWFSVAPELREKLIYSQIAMAELRADEILLYSYIASFIGFCAVATGVKMSSKYRQEKIDTHQTAIKEAHHQKSYGMKVWIVGLLVNVWSINEAGGIFDIWINQIGEGIEPSVSGYLIGLSNAMTIVGAAVLYVSMLKRNRYLSIAFIMLVSVASLAAYGGRSPVLMLIVTLVMVHNYKIALIQQLINIKLIAISSLFITFAIVAVSQRPSSETHLIGDNASLSDRISRDIVMRVGTLERKIVVIGYFDLNNIWYGQNYYSLLIAPIPRVIFQDKPPVDTGVYLKEIANGYTPQPNSPANTISETSWPEGNLAGWMNFHAIGFLIFSLVSGLLYGVGYNKMIKSEMAYCMIYFYAFMSYWGGPNLSPYYIVRILVVGGLALLIHRVYSLIYRGEKLR
jgi:hypothetical protein